MIAVTRKKKTVNSVLTFKFGDGKTMSVDWRRQVTEEKAQQLAELLVRTELLAEDKFVEARDLIRANLFDFFVRLAEVTNMAVERQATSRRQADGVRASNTKRLTDTKKAKILSYPLDKDAGEVANLAGCKAKYVIRIRREARA